MSATRGDLSTFVTYRGSDGREKVALVIGVRDEGVRDLQVFSPTGRVYPKMGVGNDPKAETLTWL